MEGSYIAHILALIFLIVKVVSMINTNETYYDLYNVTQLQTNINYASDAAIKIMLANTPDLKLDYQDYGNIDLDIKKGFDAFKNCLALTMSNYISEDVLTEVEDNIVGIVVFAYDGYYTIQRETTYDQELRYLVEGEDISSNRMIGKELCISPKIPYTIALGDGELYNINIGFSKLKKFHLDDASYEELTAQQVKETTGIDVVMETRIKLASVASDTLNRIIYNYYGEDDSAKIVIPASENFTSANSIDGVTWIAIMDTDKMLHKNIVTAIGGNTVKMTEWFVGYKRGEDKYYCAASMLDIAKKYYDLEIIRYYTTRQQAAIDGYVFDQSLYDKE